MTNRHWTAELSIHTFRPDSDIKTQELKQIVSKNLSSYDKTGHTWTLAAEIYEMKRSDAVEARGLSQMSAYTWQKLKFYNALQ